MPRKAIFFSSLSNHLLFSLSAPCRSVCCVGSALLAATTLSLSIPSFPFAPSLAILPSSSPSPNPPPPPRRLIRSQGPSTAARTLPLLLQVRAEELSSPVLGRLILLPVVVDIYAGCGGHGSIPAHGRRKFSPGDGDLVSLRAHCRSANGFCCNWFRELDLAFVRAHWAGLFVFFLCERDSSGSGAVSRIWNGAIAARRAVIPTAAQPKLLLLFLFSVQCVWDVRYFLCVFIS
jgi:hypothetical protein